MGTLDHFIEILEHFPLYVVCPVLCRPHCVVKGRMRPQNPGKPTQTIEHTCPSLIKLDDMPPNIPTNQPYKSLISLTKDRSSRSSFYCYCTIILFINPMFSMT